MAVPARPHLDAKLSPELRCHIDWGIRSQHTVQSHQESPGHKVIAPAGLIWMANQGPEGLSGSAAGCSCHEQPPMMGGWCHHRPVSELLDMQQAVTYLSSVAGGLPISQRANVVMWLCSRKAARTQHFGQHASYGVAALYAREIVWPPRNSQRASSQSMLLHGPCCMLLFASVASWLSDC